MDILQEILDTWSTEAQDEKSNRYFYNIKDIDSIKNGKKFFIIGRKGSGKTAIAKFLDSQKTYSHFSIKLNFKSFPFNELYKLYDDGYTFPNQYITIWKYVIYSNIAKMLIKNENINLELRRKLEIIYQKDPLSLAGKIKQWTDIDFKLHLASFSAKRQDEQIETTWMEKVEILEKLLFDNIDESQYYIIFDELDEDYREIISRNKDNEYLSLIISLFKAVQNIKSIFEDKNNTILPIVLLRDDIYEILTDNDKNKWYNHTIYINWNLDNLKDLLAFRISRTIDTNSSEILGFKDAWFKIFVNKKVPFGNVRNRKFANIFNHIARLTHLRPRDFTFYILECAKISKQKHDELISIETVKQADEAFSNYLKREVQDEIFAVLPNINKIFNIFSQFKKQTFKHNDIKQFYTKNSLFNDLSKEEQNIDFVLKILFHFSIIGNQPTPDIRVFKYTNKEATINYKMPFTIHRGFFRSLNVNKTSNKT